MTEITKARAERCVTHHYGCDCREYRLQETERERDELWRRLRSCEEARRYYTESLCHGDMRYALKAGGSTPAIDVERIGEVLAQRDEAMALLRRYRDETPLGHQPHMIAHEVDALRRRVLKDE